jgi:hypothetical protein
MSKYTNSHFVEIKAFTIKNGLNLKLDDDWSHTSIFKGSSGCQHLPKYLICLSDSQDTGMMSRESLYDYLKEIKINGQTYNVYLRNVGCIECSIIIRDSKD